MAKNTWEAPNLGPLFCKLNKEHFRNQITNVDVKWSSRMTVCAGICTYNGKKAGAVIHLSSPLLSLRPRRDLIDILLHEMIHAYLYTVDGNKEREEHGPKFRTIMERINTKAGTKITIFHTFDDEVESLRKHWWRCTGNCKDLPPMHGLVMRSINRPPGPTESWWTEHRKSCTGKFVKVKEPSPRPQLTAKRRVLTSNPICDEKSRTRINSAPSSSMRNKENCKPKKCEGRKRGQSTTCPARKTKARSMPKKVKRSEAKPKTGPAEESESDSDSDSDTDSPYDSSDTDTAFEDDFPAFDHTGKYCPACGIKLEQTDLTVEQHLMACPVLNYEEDVHVSVSNLKYYPCPICLEKFTDQDMNAHLDLHV